MMSVTKPSKNEPKPTTASSLRMDKRDTIKKLVHQMQMLKKNETAGK